MSAECQRSCSVSFDTRGDFASVRQLQSELNEQYRRDISKHASGRALQVQSIYDQLPIMLEGENKRFVLNSIDPKAHYEKYQRILYGLSMPALPSKPIS